MMRYIARRTHFIQRMFVSLPSYGQALLKIFIDLKVIKLQLQISTIFQINQYVNISYVMMKTWPVGSRFFRTSIVFLVFIYKKYDRLHSSSKKVED